MKDAKRFLWSHYNPDGVCIFLRRIVKRTKFLDKKTFYVRSASDTTRTCNRNIYGWSPSKYTLEGPTTDGIRIPKLTPTRRSGRKGRQIVASPVLSSLVDFFSSSVLVVLLGMSRFRILRAGAALEGDNQHMNGIFAG